MSRITLVVNWPVFLVVLPSRTCAVRFQVRRNLVGTIQCHRLARTLEVWFGPPSEGPTLLLNRACWCVPTRSPQPVPTASQQPDWLVARERNVGSAPIEVARRSTIHATAIPGRLAATKPSRARRTVLERRPPTRWPSEPGSSRSNRKPRSGRPFRRRPADLLRDRGGQLELEARGTRRRTA